MASRPFSVGVPAEFVTPDGKIREGLGWDSFAPTGIPWSPIPTVDGKWSAESLSLHPAYLLGTALVTPAAIAAADPAPLVRARFGIGTDTVDMDGCTRRDTIVAITPDGTARPMAVGALAYILASTLQMHVKDEAVRCG